MKENNQSKESFSLPELLNKYDKLKAEVARLRSNFFNREKLDAFFYNSPLPMVCIYENCEVLFVNKLFTDVIGLQKEQVIGNSICDFIISKNDKDTFQKNIELLFEGEKSRIRQKFVFKDGDGKKLVFETRSRLVKYDDDIVQAVHIIFQDVSQEEKFREAYRNLVENSLQAILIIQDFRIVFANQKAADISGYSIKEMKELDINGVKKLIHPEDRNRMFDLMKQRFSGKRVSPKQEFRGIRKNGSVYWIEILASYTNFNGKPALQIVQLDISEKKEAETQASSVENKYVNLVEQSIIGVYIITDNKFTYVNPRFASIFGFDQSEMIGKITPEEIIHPDDVATVKENLRKRIEGEVQSLHYQFKGLTKKGKTIYVEVHGSRAELDDKIAVIGMLQDITERKETEEKLYLQSTALNSAANGIVITDTDGIILYANPAFTKLTGYSFDEIIGENPRILKSGAHDDNYYKNIWSTISKGEVWDGEIINKRKDGSLYTERQTITPVPGENSEIEYFIAIKSDVTESKKTERALKESEEKLRNIIEHSNEMFYIHDTNHVLTYVSPQSQEILGYSQEEMKFEWTRLVTDNPINDKGFEKTVKAIETGIRQDDYLLELNRKDGKKIFVQISESPLKNSENKVIGIAGALSDVTEKILAERALKESEERFRGLYENAILGIYRTSPDGNILMANPALLNLLGYSSFEEFKKLNAKFALYADPETRAEFKKIVNEKGEIFGFETIAKKKDGTEFYIRESARQVKDGEGNILYYEGIIEDITSQKEAEQKLIEAKEAAEKSDLLKSDFLAQMSHEIRTPINVIQSFSGLIKDEVKHVISKELLNSFNIIDNASRRMIRTIDLILNMSQLQTDSYTLSKSEIDLYNDIFVQIYPELSRLAEEKDLKLNIKDPGEILKVNVDEYSVRQVFDNLIHNAIKYTHKGSVNIDLIKNSKNVIVEIKDTGIGISKEYLPHLFKPFTQEEHGYTRKYEGNGLGLALVKRYCELNNIEINVDSEKNEGTTFTLVFHSVVN